MDYVKTILWWAVVIFVALVAFIVITDLITTITKFFKSLANYYDSKSSNASKMEIQMENSVNLIMLIDKMIDIHLTDRQRVQLMLKVPFNVLKIDDDIKELSEHIHNSIDISVFSKKDAAILTPVYLESYIVNAATAALMQCYQETNQRIAQLKAME